MSESSTEAESATTVPLYRTHLGEAGLEGGRCTRCSYSTAPTTPRCPACGGEVVAAAFGFEGTVWAATVVHIQVGDREPPFGLAYVDVEDGPRVLSLFEPAARLRIGERVRLSAVGDDMIAQRVEAA